MASDNPTGKALLLFAHGKGMCLFWSAHPIINSILEYTTCPSGQPFNLETSEIIVGDFPGLLNTGLFIADIEIVGSFHPERETQLKLDHLRPATSLEWEAYRNDEFPWPVDGHVTIYTEGVH